jgi:hypothetical protein
VAAAGRCASEQRQYHIVRPNVDFWSMFRLQSRLRQEIDALLGIGARTKTYQPGHFAGEP